MAEKTVCIIQQQQKPIKITKWKVHETNVVSIGRLLLLYDYDGAEKSEQRKLKSTQAGTVRKLRVEEGAIVQPGDVLLELEACCHPTIMNDMCAECGADLRKDDTAATASVPMIHAIPDLKVSEELAQKLGRADNDRLIKDRKLVLLVDLDQTLIHTTNDNIPPNIKDVYHFQLYGPNSPWYHTRFRPGTLDFLSNINDFFELHICTFGARNYAHTIAMFLDGDQKYFSHRILSRDECFDPTSKKANLKALFPCGDNMVCIIDDREDVWSHATNLIHVKPYHFFQHTGDINAPPGLDKQENDDKAAGVDLTKLKKTEKLSNGFNEQEKNEEVKEDEKREKLSENEEKKHVNGDKQDAEEENVEENEKEMETSEKETTEKTEEKTENHKEKNEECEPKSKQQEVESEKSESNEEEDKKCEKSEEKPELNPENEAEKPETNPPESKPDESQIEIDDPDDYLVYLEDILKRIHKAFYEEFDKLESGEVPDLKTVIPTVRSQILHGVKLVFSGLVPTHLKLEQSKAYQVAKSLGAAVTQDIEDDTTHLVAVRPGTAKVNAGRRKKNLKMVTPDWLWCCAERWERVDERIFPLNSKGSKNRHPPPHCSSPEHIPSYPEHDTPALRKRTPSGRFMDTINPLMSFSSADIADMDKEVEDILDDESDSSEDEKPAPKTASDLPNEKNNSSSSESSSSEDSVAGESPKGFKRKRDTVISEENSLMDDLNNSTEDDMRSRRFKLGESLEKDLELEESQDSDGSVEPPDEVDDGEWNIMGAALEREFLSNE